MTRCVADAAALLTALAGPDPADPATAQAASWPADYAAFLATGGGHPREPADLRERAGSRADRAAIAWRL
jgi:amidase